MDSISPYRVSDDVSYCQVDDYLVFLDIRRDRYFRLSKSLEQAFVNYIDGDGQPGVETDRLVDNGVLTSALPSPDRRSTEPVEAPLHSAVEKASSELNIGLYRFLEAAAVTLSTRRQLKVHTLKHVLDATRDYRERRCPEITRKTSAVTQRSLIDAAVTFRRVRLYLPVDTICLMDSVAMVRFLARQHLYARVVFGVACDPFSAHCWVQAGNLVLNDTTGNASLHTPIMVI